MDHNVTWKLPIFVFVLVKMYICLPHIIHSGKQNFFIRTTSWTNFHTFLEESILRILEVKVLCTSNSQKSCLLHGPYILIVYFEC